MCEFLPNPILLLEYLFVQKIAIYVKPCNVSAGLIITRLYVNFRLLLSSPSRDTITSKGDTHHAYSNFRTARSCHRFIPCLCSHLLQRKKTAA